MDLIINVEVRLGGGAVYNKDITLDKWDLHDAVVKKAHEQISEDWNITPIWCSIKVVNNG